MAEGQRRISVTPEVKGLNKFLGDYGKITKANERVAQRIALVNKRFEQLGVKMLNFENRGKSVIRFNVALQRGFASQADVAKKLGITLEELGEIVAEVNADFDKSEEVVGQAGVTMDDLSKAIGIIKPKLIAVAGVALRLAKAVISVPLRALQKGFELLTSPIRKATDAIKKFISRALAITTGVLIRDVIFGLLRGFKELAQGIVGVVFELSLLDVRLETLIAREERLKRANEDVAISFGDITKKARALRDWIVKVSLAIPFEFEAIARTTAFGMAMGFTADQARQLTLSVSAFAAGMGLTSSEMDQIIFNFGQMKRAGKVTGTEMRDLARGAFFPLVDVLDEAGKMMGVATDNMVEFRKAAAEGKVDINTFFQAFINIVERDFPDALERLGRTLVGVRTRFMNFLKAIVGIEILGPTIDAITERAANALDKLLTPAIIATAKAMGQVLLKSFTIVSHFIKSELFPALKNLAAAFGFTSFTIEGFARSLGKMTAIMVFAIRKIGDIINFLAKFLSDAFNKIAGRAESWGENIILSLAKGMASVIGFIVKVLTRIANVISGWLSAKSPPKLLPDLDKWGAAAMTEYLLGWLKGDFSIFNDIANLMESFIRSIPSTIFDEIQVVPTILKIREAIAGAINRIREFGRLTAQEINNILKTARELPESFRAYIRALFDVETAIAAVTRAQIRVEQANEAVKRSQDALNAVSDKYSGILDDLNKQLRGVTTEFDEQARLAKINEALASGLLTTEEQARLNAEKRAIGLRQQIRATEDQRDTEIDAAQAKIDAAEEVRLQAEIELETASSRQKMAQDQLDASRALIDVQIKQNDLIAEQIALLERLAKTGAGDGEIPEPIDLTDLGGFDIDIEPLDLERIMDAFNEGLFGMTTALTDLEEKLGEIFDPLTGEDGAFAQLAKAMEPFTGEDGIIANYSEKWTDFVDNKVPKIVDAFSQIGDIFEFLSGIIDSMIESIGLNLEESEADHISLGDIIDGVIQNIIAVFSFVEIVIGGVIIVILGLINLWVIAIGVLKDKWQDIKDWWAEKLVPSFNETFVNADSPFQKALDQIGEMIDKVETGLTDAWNFFTDEIVPTVIEAWEKIRSKVESVTDWVLALVSALGSLNFAKLISLLFGGPAKTGGKPPKEGQHGLDLIVPAGFPSDTFPFLATTGERVLIQTKRQQRLQEAMIRQFATNVTVAAPAGSTGSITNNSTSVEINATYANVQSEAAIRHDVQLALAATMR